MDFAVKPAKQRPKSSALALFRWEFAPEFAEEIEDEGDLIHYRGLFGAGGLQYCEAFAVGVQVEIRRVTDPTIWAENVAHRFGVPVSTRVDQIAVAAQLPGFAAQL